MDTQITSFSQEALDKLFDDIPNSTPTADVLDNTKITDKSTDFKMQVADNSSEQIIDMSLEELDKLEKESEDNTGNKGDDKTGDDKTTDTDDKTNVDVVETPEYKQTLKTQADYLVAQGIWKDFEGREELTEIDSETFAKLAAAQDAERLKERFDELVDSTGDYGKAIINHIKNGGNPEDVIDLFKEQKELENFDTSSEQGKLDYIYTYYSEIIGWKEDKIKTFIEKTILKSDNKDEALSAEFSEVEEKFKDYYKSQLDTINKEQENIKRQNEEKQKTFVSNIKEALNKQENLTEAEKKLIEKSIVEFKHKLPNGAVVNDFYLKFAEKQKDPLEYTKLVHFILDREGYEKKLEQSKESKKAEKNWQFIKGNANIKKNGSVAPSKVEDNNSKLDFSVVFKR